VPIVKASPEALAFVIEQISAYHLDNVICGKARMKNPAIRGRGFRGAVLASPIPRRIEMTIGTIILVVLVLLLIGAIPRWSYNRQWGYGPTGGLGLIVLIVVVLILMGRI